MPKRTSLLNAHSVSALKLRDRSSAETLDVPGICPAESQIPRSIAQEQMVPVMLSEGKDLSTITLILTYCSSIAWDNPYVLPPTASQTLSEASEVRVKSRTPWSIDLSAEGSESTHQFKSLMLSGYRDINPSKSPRESRRTMSLSRTKRIQRPQFSPGKSGHKSSDKGGYVANSEQAVGEKRAAQAHIYCQP